MTRSGRRRAWPAQSRVVWLSALLSAVVVVLVALAPWASGQQQLSQWRAADAQLRWIPARSSGLPRYPVEGEATYRPSQLRFGDPSPVQIIHRFTLPTIPAGPWAVLLPEVDGQARVFANGVPVSESIPPSAPGLARSSAQGRLWEAPGTYLHAGENRIDIVVSGAAMRPLTSGVYLGPQSSLEPVAKAHVTRIENARRLVLALSLTALLANLIAVAFRAPVFHLAIAAAFGAVGTRVLLASDASTAGPFWPVADQLLFAGVALCVASAVRSAAGDTVRATHRVEAASLALAGTLGLASLLAAGAGIPHAVLISDGAIAASLVYLVGTVHAAAPRIAAGGFTSQALAGSALGLGVVIFSIAAPGAGGLSLAWPPFAADLGLAVGLILAAVLATAVGLTRGGSLAFSLLRARLDQSRVIEQQQLALDAAAQALDLKTRQSAILEERQRMARDVHDGIGGQLASLIAQVRLRRVNMDHVEQALVGGLSELRLLVDSLDLVGETLADALASFLVRARQQTAAVGVRLEWSQTDDLAAEIIDPQWTLNLYRLMQEAITNALRHSGGDLISVSIQSVEGRTLSVRIEDNGTAFDPQAVQTGRGLANMAHRAKELGGTFSVSRAAPGGGTVVRVDVPAPG